MFHTHLSWPNSPPSICLAADAAPSAFDWHCHLPLALERADVQAEVNLGFRFELTGGPLAQGAAIRVVTLPPGGAMQLLLHERHSRLILETDGPSHHRCEAVAAETIYLQELRHALRRLGLLQNDHRVAADDNLHVTGTPVSFPFLAAVVQGFIDRAEAASRTSEAAARTTRSARSAPAHDDSALPSRLLTNSNRRRALTLFVYHAEKFQLACLELHQIDRGVKAPSAVIAAEVEAEIDRNLIELKLIDQRGRVTSAARSRFGWQRAFRLPTPHVLVKTCLIDVGSADMASGDVTLDVQLGSGCAA